MIEFIAGATAMASLAVGWNFLRFFRSTDDRLFLIFSIAFFVFAANRVILSALDEGHEATTYVYMSRLLGFVLILIAIIDKNRSHPDT